MDDQLSDSREPLTCPFCSFEDSDTDFLIQHVNMCHPESDLIGGLASEVHNPAVAADDATENLRMSDPEECLNEPLYIPCPHGCGEPVLTSEVASHLDLHAAEALALDDLGVYDHSQGNVAVDDLRYFSFPRFCTSPPLQGQSNQGQTLWEAKLMTSIATRLLKQSGMSHSRHTMENLNPLHRPRGQQDLG